MPQKRGLGRGLDALLGAAKTEPQPTDTLDKLSIKQIQPGRYQPRQQFDEDKLRELANSVHAQGLIQPIVVRPGADDRYEIIAGERRWRAAQLAGLSEVPVIIRQIDDQTAMAWALIENMQRDDLKPLEEAAAIRRLLEECQLTHQQVAEGIGKSRASVSNLLRLLELHPAVSTLLERGELDMGHARALLGLTGETQHRAAQQVVRKHLTVRATEALVRQHLANSVSADTTHRPDPDQQYQTQLAALTRQLGTRISLKPTRHNPDKGKLVIPYNSPDQLQQLFDQLQHL
ncbi:MAG: ParB/RepB/Spo0J family partition protein [Pseudomonadota bacterium]